MSLKIGRIVMGMCQTNCYFVYEEGKKDVIVFDPADKGDILFRKLTDAGFTVRAMLLTHGHFDHIWGVNKLRDLSGAKVYAYEGEKELCEDAVKNVSGQAGRAETVVADEYIRDGEIIEVAGMRCRLIATPGHTQGSCCYYFEGDGILISGDTLFQESIGRTDLPTGSYSALIHSVQDKLMSLPDEVKVYPGHGDETSIGHERKYNPFV